MPEAYKSLTSVDRGHAPGSCRALAYASTRPLASRRGATCAGVLLGAGLAVAIVAYAGGPLRWTAQRPAAAKASAVQELVDEVPRETVLKRVVTDKVEVQMKDSDVEEKILVKGPATPAHQDRYEESRSGRYSKVSKGSCATVGSYPILDPVVCEAAAMELGLEDDTVQVIPWPQVAPEGCYYKARRTLWFSEDPANGGRGVVGDREQLCARAVVLAPTTTTTWTWTSTSTTVTSSPWGSPSLLCFSVMRPNSTEEGLVKYQLKNRMSIFACDEFIIVSTEKRWLGENEFGSVFTWAEPAAPARHGSKKGWQETHWLNTQVFISAVDSILKDGMGRLWKHDWLVKLDPDTVFFPDRLRKFLKPHTPGCYYFTNCRKYGSPVLYGAMEVFSISAMRKYREGQSTCKKKLPWRHWGEDMYFRKCMDLVGVDMLEDTKMVGDNRCEYSSCADGTRAAYHPYGNVEKWKKCFYASTR